jgi:quinol monooxygenase YgiN
MRNQESGIREFDRTSSGLPTTYYPLPTGHLPIMICITVLLTVKNEADVPKVKELLARHGELSRTEPGCLRFELYHSENDRRVFILNERWENEDLLAQHRLAEGYTTIYTPQVLPLVERTPHRSTLVSG